MKIFITLLLFILILPFSVAQKNHFKFLKAESMDWVAGIPQGGRGTEYYIRLVIKTNKPIAFDSLWVKNIKDSATTIYKNFKPGISKGNTYYGTKYEIKKNDTITLRISDHTPSGDAIPDDNAPELKTIKPPFFFKGKILVKYYVRGKKYFFRINKPKTRPTEYRP